MDSKNEKEKSSFSLHTLPVRNQPWVRCVTVSVTAVSVTVSVTPMSVTPVSVTTVTVSVTPVTMSVTAVTVSVTVSFFVFVVFIEIVVLRLFLRHGFVPPPIAPVTGDIITAHTQLAQRTGPISLCGCVCVRV